MLPATRRSTRRSEPRARAQRERERERERKRERERQRESQGAWAREWARPQWARAPAVALLRLATDCRYTSKYENQQVADRSLNMCPTPYA
jgi:hypothetical protein